jgi:hypothetical protein
MKFVVLFLLVFSLISNVFGQTIDNRESVVIVQSTRSPITQKDVDNYTNFNEWHFELRLDPEQRQKYQSLLIEDLKKSQLSDDVIARSAFMNEFKKKGWMELFKVHSDFKQLDLIDYTAEHNLNGDGNADWMDSMIVSMGGQKPDRSKIERKIYGTGIAANLRRSAKSEYKSATYLSNFIKEYQKPLIGDGSIYTSLFKRDIDAMFEWLSFRMIMVAGKKVVQGNLEERKLMEERIVNAWKIAQTNPNNLSKYRSWLRQTVDEWLIWRGGEYSFYGRQTPFGKKEQLAIWGKEILAVSPEMRPYVEFRIKEYKDYVAKMPSDELKREIEIKQRTNAEFSMRMQQIQNEMKDNQRMFAAMRQNLMNLHVANLNIAENIGNTGFTWQIRSQP